MSLEEQLVQITRKSQESMPRRVMEVIEKQIDDLAQSGIRERFAKISARMPDSELLDIRGKAVYLKGFWAKGPLVMSFYRGGW